MIKVDKQVDLFAERKMLVEMMSSAGNDKERAEISSWIGQIDSAMKQAMCQQALTSLYTHLESESFTRLVQSDETERRFSIGRQPSKFTIKSHGPGFQLKIVVTSNQRRTIWATWIYREAFVGEMILSPELTLLVTTISGDRDTDSNIIDLESAWP